MPDMRAADRTHEQSDQSTQARPPHPLEPTTHPTDGHALTTLFISYRTVLVLIIPIVILPLHAMKLFAGINCTTDVCCVLMGQA